MYIYIYKKNCIDLYFKKPLNTVPSTEEKEPSPYTIVRNFEKLNEQWEENWQKECAVYKQHETQTKLRNSFFLCPAS